MSSPPGRAVEVVAKWVVLSALLCLACGEVPRNGEKGVPPEPSPAGSLPTPRTDHTTTVLPSGELLVIGGRRSLSNTESDEGRYEALNSVEVYDPATGAWSSTGSMTTSYVHHTATLLSSGKVLVVYGRGAEVYDPATGGWSRTGALTTARSGHTATLLPSGKVLVVGGGNASAEIYDPDTGQWSPAGTLARARTYHQATVLPSSKVLFTGGTASRVVEVYDPATAVWSATVALVVTDEGHTATLLPSGKVLFTGFGWDSLARAELYDPGT